MATSTRPARFGRSFWLGAVLLGVGGLLLAAAGAYYGYGLFAARGFDDLVATNPGVTEVLEPSVRRDSQQATPTPQPLAATPTEPGESPAPSPGPSPQPPATAPQRPAPDLQYLYPGSLMPARQWADPRGTIALAQPDLDGFTPLSSQGQPLINGSVGRAERIIIPQLHIDSAVKELTITNLASSAEYETPKFVVGHIPATPNPGSGGNGWYFGHLESPVEGEGNVFASLPRVPDLLRNGEDVHVILHSGGRDYLYSVSRTDFLHRDELALYGSDDARVTLVTCFPRLKYDHRLLITGHLIGFRDAAPA